MDYHVLSHACTYITYAHHMHQCYTCLHTCHVFAFQSGWLHITTYLVHLTCLSEIFSYLSLCVSKNINGIKASSRGPAMTHVMYANGIIIFSKATLKEAHNINAVLEKYYSWFRQRISKSKLGVFFTKLTHPSHCRHIKEILQLKNLKEDSIYLGAPLILSRSPSLDFSYLCEKSWAGEVSAYPR